METELLKKLRNIAASAAQEMSYKDFEYIEQCVNEAADEIEQLQKQAEYWENKWRIERESHGESVPW